MARRQTRSRYRTCSRRCPTEWRTHWYTTESLWWAGERIPGRDTTGTNILLCEIRILLELLKAEIHQCWLILMIYCPSHWLSGQMVRELSQVTRVASLILEDVRNTLSKSYTWV